MTTYTTITNAQVDQDSPITASLITALRDNPIAITEGASGAPKIQTDGLADESVTLAKLNPNAFARYLYTGDNSSIAIGTSLATAVDVFDGGISIDIPTNGWMRVHVSLLIENDAAGSSSDAPRIGLGIGGTYYQPRYSNGNPTRGSVNPWQFNSVADNLTGYYEDCQTDCASIDAMVGRDSFPTGTQTLTLGLYSNGGEDMTYRGDTMVGRILLEIINGTS